MSEALAPNPDEMMQEATDAAKNVVDGAKPPKSDVEIADQVGRITWKLGKRIDQSSQQERQTDHRRGTAYSKPITMPIPDGGKVESHLRLGHRSVTSTNAEGDVVHTAGAQWKHGNGGTVERHTGVGTESLDKKGRSRMYTVDKSGLMSYEPKIHMDISNDPREWEEKFKPATEEVRSQAIHNAAGTLSEIRGAVAEAEITKRTEKPAGPAA